MDWISDVRKAISFIKKDLLEDIGVEDVCQHVLASRDHYQQVFFIVAGVSISEYIRNRRLTRAGHQLRSSADKIIDVALRYHYETPASFTKAFTRFHGCPPSAVRSRRGDVKSFEPITIQINVQGGFSMSRSMIGQIPIRQLISMNAGQNYWLTGAWTS